MPKETKIKVFSASSGYAPPISHEDYEDWLGSVRNLLGLLEFRSEESFRIFNVPSGKKKHYRDPYAPRTVSIGPLHRDKNLDRYLFNDVRKWRYMLHFLHRSADPVKALDKCAETIKGLEEASRRTYWKTVSLTKLEMMEMLLVDGCFLLELFIRYKEQREDDPLLGGAWMLEDLQHDLALLENQIPFDILQGLFENLQQQSVDQFTSKKELTKYSLLFFLPALNLTRIEDKLINFLTEKPTIMHILDLIHNVYLSTFPDRPNYRHTTIQIDKTPNNESSLRKLGFRQSAKKLENEGIQFKGGDKDLLLHISFEKAKGVLTIPYMSINESTKSIFKNLIAFEQCRPGGKPQILSSYVILMRGLLDSKHDVELLQEKDIIEKNPISAENILKFFKDLCAEVDLKEFQFWWVCEEVDAHIKARRWWRIIQSWANSLWHDSKVTLKEKYFKTTWSMLSVAAAIVLLILTALQTVYTLITYYHQG